MIQKDMMVMITYDLSVDNKLVESATLERPLRWCFGHGRMLQSFEDRLAGLNDDDPFDFVLTADQAYGPRHEDGLMPLERSIFEVDGHFDADRYAPGSPVSLRGENGAVFHATVSSVTDSQVIVDFNHPLAGKELHFTGRVIDVRPATDDELAALSHACGCGGGCGGNCDDAGCEGGGCNGCGGC